MSFPRITLTLVLAFGAAVGARAAQDAVAPRTDVVFSHPEQFTDASDGPRGTDLRRDANLQELKDYLVRRAERYVAPDQRLSITVTDVDLAGEVEPWRTRGAEDIRYIRSIYPPRINLTFRLTDAAGNVIKEGSRHLTDQTFDMNLNAHPSDPRVYEKRLIDDWLTNEFSRAKK